MGARSLRSFHILLVLGAGAMLLPMLQSKPPTRTDVRFEQFDRNHDGYLSSVELDDFGDVAIIFQQADYDRDGLLSSPEFQAALDAPPRHR